MQIQYKIKGLTQLLKNLHAQPSLQTRAVLPTEVETKISLIEENLASLSHQEEANSDQIKEVKQNIEVMENKLTDQIHQVSVIFIKLTQPIEVKIFKGKSKWDFYICKQL